MLRINNALYHHILGFSLQTSWWQSSRVDLDFMCVQDNLGGILLDFQAKSRVSGCIQDACTWIQDINLLNLDLAMKDKGIEIRLERQIVVNRLDIGGKHLAFSGWGSRLAHSCRFLSLSVSRSSWRVLNKQPLFPHNPIYQNIQWNNSNKVPLVRELKLIEETRKGVGRTVVKQAFERIAEL